LNDRASRKLNGSPFYTAAEHNRDGFVKRLPINSKCYDKAKLKFELFDFCLNYLILHLAVTLLIFRQIYFASD